MSIRNPPLLREAKLYLKTLILIVIVLVLSATTILYSATTGKLSGIVKDAQTGEPLPGANIIIDGTMMGASSNLDGEYYVINVPPGHYDVRATMMGFQTLVQKKVLIRVDLTTEVNFRLSSTVLDLGDVVEVVAERPIVQKDLTSGRSIVTSDEIKEMPVESFQGVLSTKAGVTQGADGAMHIRGGRSSEISYMIDGIAVSNPFWGGLAVQVENTAIQELQVVSGTFNAEYGQAMSGVVNIVTKEGGSNYHGTFSSYLGDHISDNTDIFMNIDDVDPLSQLNFDASLHGPVPMTNNRLTFFASGRYYNDKGYVYGQREHNPGDAVFLPSSTSEVLALSPYNKEAYFDLNRNGKYDTGEPYLDTDGNGQWDPREPRINFYEDFEDVNGNGLFDQAEEFTDLNQNGVYDFGEPFIDLDGNGFYSEMEPYSDYNMNGIRDIGFTGDNKLISMNPYEKFSGQAKLSYRISPNITVRYNLLYDQIKNKSYDSGTHLFRYNPDGQPTSYQMSMSNKLDFTHQISASTFYEFKLAHYEYDFKQYLYKDWKDPRYLPNILLTSTPGDEFYAGGQDKDHTYRNSRTSVARFDLTSQVNRAHQVKLGVEGKYHELYYHYYYVDINETNDWVPTIYTPETSTGNDEYLRFPKEFAAYVQDKIELKDMIVNIGLRYDYFNSAWKVAADNRDRFLIAGNRTSLDDLKLKNASVKHHVSPRLGIAYPITDQGTIHFSYGHFFQIPPFSYLYSNPEFEVISGRNKSVLGNADLDPQKTVIYEIGLQQQLAQDIGVEVIVFYKDIIDWLGTEIFELYTRGDYYNRYATIDFGNVKGITFSLEKRRMGYLSGSIDYTYSVAEGNSSDPLSKFYDLQTVPPRESEKRVVPLDWDQTHTLNFNVTVSVPRNWGISLLGRLSSGLPYTPTRDAIRVDAENSERKPSQMNFDLHAHKEYYFNSDTYISLFVKVYNLFDRLNELYVYSDTGRATYALYPNIDFGDQFGRHHLDDYLTRPHYYSSPRSIRFGLTMGF